MGRSIKQPPIMAIRRAKDVDEKIAEQINAGIALFKEYVGPLNQDQENSIRMLEEKFAQALLHIAVIEMSNDREAIKRLCHEVLNIASDEACVEYGDTLRAMVRDIAIGEDVYRERYPQWEEYQHRDGLRHREQGGQHG